MGKLSIKRVYDEALPEDGSRLLVDRLWPRGVSKERAALTSWEKGAAPSPELRKLFHSGALSYEDFSAAYLKELDESPEARDFAARVSSLLEKGNVTLVYAARSEDNHAKVLLSWLQTRLAG